jgi:hypothetical protein
LEILGSQPHRELSARVIEVKRMLSALLQTLRADR